MSGQVTRKFVSVDTVRRSVVGNEMMGTVQISLSVLGTMHFMESNEKEPCNCRVLQQEPEGGNAISTPADAAGEQYDISSC